MCGLSKASPGVECLRALMSARVSKEAFVTTTRTKIAHVFRRLGFGPKPSDIDGWEAVGPAALIENLLNRPAVVPTATRPNPWGFPTGTDSTAMNTFAARQIELMAFGPSTSGTGVTSSSYNPLQERIAWILQGILVTAVVDVTYFPDVADHVSLLRSSALGSYAELLTRMSPRPGMLKYLSGYLSTKDHPNQNFARELMELFTIGRVHPLSGESNYNQGDLQEIARALTGYQYNWANGTTYFDPASWDAGPKTFRGQSIGNAGLQEVITALTEHPSFAYFIPLRFYQELVGLNPTPETLDTLADAWGTSGDILALVSTIARLPEFISDAAIYAKVKQPVELIASAARLMGAPNLTNPNLTLYYFLTILDQHPLIAPNVKGWPSGDRFLGENTLTIWSQLAVNIAAGGLSWNGLSSPTPFVQTLYSQGTPSTAAALALRLAGFDGASSPSWTYLNDFATSGTWNAARAASLASLLLLTPEFLAC